MITSWQLAHDGVIRISFVLVGVTPLSGVRICPHLLYSLAFPPQDHTVTSVTTTNQLQGYCAVLTRG